MLVVTKVVKQNTMTEVLIWIHATFLKVRCRNGLKSVRISIFKLIYVGIARMIFVEDLTIGRFIIRVHCVCMHPLVLHTLKKIQIIPVIYRKSLTKYIQVKVTLNFSRFFFLNPSCTLGLIKLFSPRHGCEINVILLKKFQIIKYYLYYTK